MTERQPPRPFQLTQKPVETLEAENEKLRFLIAELMDHVGHCATPANFELVEKNLLQRAEAAIQREKHLAQNLMPLLNELWPWAKRMLILCHGGSEIRHTALDGCGPIVFEERCKHGVLRYCSMADMVRRALGKKEEEGRREVTQSGKEGTDSSERIDHGKEEKADEKADCKSGSDSDNP